MTEKTENMTEKTETLTEKTETLTEKTETLTEKSEKTENEKRENENPREIRAPLQVKIFSILVLGSRYFSKSSAVLGESLARE